MNKLMIGLAAFAAMTGAFGLRTAEAAPRASQIRVCVDVVPKTWTAAGARPSPAAEAVAATPPSASAVPPAASAPPPVAPPPGSIAAPVPAPIAPPPSVRPVTAPPQAATEVRFRPELLLKRLVEYQVTHDESYDAVSEGCTERMTLELYEIHGGWTVFGRFSRFAREEKVDHVGLDEFAALAERMARALLWDRAIEATINRKNVLRDDSETETRRIQGSSFASLGLGTAARFGKIPTVGDDPAAKPVNQLRLMTPVAISAGLRQEIGAWGLDALAQLDFGTNERAASRNQTGGHADYSWGSGATLHFVRYLEPAGMNSVYLGGGATFRLQRFTIIRAVADRGSDSRDGVWSGGLDLDLVAGYEFLRANSVHFFAQAEVNAPTYVVQDETDSGQIKSYLPGAAARVGILF